MPAGWTFITYIAAHNDLEEFGRRSLGQLLGGPRSPGLNVAVLYDGPGGAARYAAGEPSRPVIEEALGRFDSGDPDALLETVRWAVAHCPARRYALVLWSHGTGWRPEELKEVAREARGDDAVSASEADVRAAQPSSMALFRTTLARLLGQRNPAERAVCFDDGSGHSLDSLELGRVMREVEDRIEQPLDLLGMDACLMGSLEVAYQVRRHARFLVASEEMVPAHSWPYDTILAALRERPEMSGEELASSVVRHYVDYYTVNPPKSADVTKIALDLSRIDTIKDAVDRLAGALLADMPEVVNDLWAAQRLTRQAETLQETRKPTKFGFQLWDLGTLASRLVERSKSAGVARAARAVGSSIRVGGAVLAEGHRGAWLDGTGGLSIYAPPPGVQRLSPFYDGLDLTRDARWGEMLKAYHQELA